MKDIDVIREKMAEIEAWEKVRREATWMGYSVRRGRMEQSYWVHCGICEYHEPCTPSIGQSNVEFAIEQGWRRTKKYGWVCADHKPTPTEQEDENEG